MKSYKTLYHSPVGLLTLVANDIALTALLWENDTPERVKITEDAVEKENMVLQTARKQLEEYFQGTRRIFDLPLQFNGTDFQKLVWRTLLAIPYGETRSYGQLAKQINQPNASRAVGAANGKNPISIIVPCHRVVGSSGNLTGFAGGVHVKKMLLDLESPQKEIFS